MSDTRSVLVTGSSRGLGLATAAALSRRGWQVFASMRDLGRKDLLEEATRGLAEPVRYVQLDVTDAASVDAAIAEVVSITGGHLDAVVNNAGLAGGGFFEEVSDAEQHAVMETNFFGCLRLTRKVIPVMRAAGGGRIVVVSSVGAFISPPALSAYVASKWALEGWCESMAAELAPFGIRMLLVEPGTLKTGIWDSPLSPSASGPYRAWAEAMGPRVEAMVRRLGEIPHRPANGSRWLLSSSHPTFRNPVGPDAWPLGSQPSDPFPPSG